MPSDQTGSAGTASQPQSGAGNLLDSQGRAVKQGRAVNKNGGQLKHTGGQADEFIRTQPLAAVLIALGIGYILGRIGF